jgi:glutaredoxin|tara:strand:+ start:160 stop:516 length:357 start_codon:yes stop_codon:yes gene_type:complete
MGTNDNLELDYVQLINENNKGIFIISKENCPLCDKLKQLFETINIEYSIYKYQETNNEKNNNFPFKTEMKNCTGGIMFPFCYFNGEYVGSYKHVHQNLITGKLQKQLNQIGLEYEEDF